MLALLLSAWQFTSEAISPNELAQANQHLTQIIGQLHQLDPNTLRQYVVTKSARMRSGLCKEDAFVLALPADASVTIIESEGDWLGGEYTNDQGVQRYGWIYRKNFFRRPK